MPKNIQKVRQKILMGNTDFRYHEKGPCWCPKMRNILKPYRKMTISKCVLSYMITLSPLKMNTDKMMGNRFTIENIIVHTLKWTALYEGNLNEYFTLVQIIVNEKKIKLILPLHVYTQYSYSFTSLSHSSIS